MRIFFGEFIVFLIRKGFDGTGINNFFAETGEVLNGEFGGQCFARAGVGGHEDVLLFNNGFNRIFLKVTERLWIQFKMSVIL